MRTNSSGQSILEYMIVIGVVTIVLISMGPMFRRGIQSLMKVTADQLAVQQEADQSDEAFLIGSNSTVRSISSRTRRDLASNEFMTTDDSLVETESESVIFLGFSNRTGN